MSWLNGSVAVVTGGGSGIGESIARALARAGCDLVIADIDAASAEVVAAGIRTLGRRSSVFEVDVSDKASVMAMAERVYDEFGKVDVLINNAGVSLRPFRAIWDASDEDWHWIMDINFWGVLHNIQAFVPRMLNQPGRKHIVNTSSVAPWLAIGGHAPYTASKAAIDGLSASLRSELDGEDIGLTMLLPGHVATRLATSERIRSEGERSNNRDVKAYGEYVDARLKSGGREQTRNPYTDGPQSAASASYLPIEAEETGEMVVEAILANRPYCLTHPAPVQEIDTLVRMLKDAHPATRAS